MANKFNGIIFKSARLSVTVGMISLFFVVSIAREFQLENELIYYFHLTLGEDRRAESKDSINIIL
jgi:hypothetical protein